MYRYRHELAFRPTLDRITRRYARHKKEVDRYVQEAWGDWNSLGNPRSLQPEIYAPGGKRHMEYLSGWHHLRLTLRRHPPGERERYADSFWGPM